MAQPIEGVAYTKRPGAGAYSAPGHPSLPGAHSVAIIGDSLTVAGGPGESAIKSRLVALGYDIGSIWWYAVSGKAINIADANNRLTVDDIAQARADLGVEPSTWVIALGTNGYNNSTASNTTRVNLMTAALADAPRVLWVGVSINPTNTLQTQFNSLVPGLLAPHDQFSWLDWDAHIKAQPNQSLLWNSDGIHLTTAGYNVRHDWLAAQIGAPA